MSELHPSAVRQPAVAGLFYPQDPAELAKTVDAFLSKARRSQGPPHNRPPYAVVVPHAGYVYSGAIAAPAYQLLARFRSRIHRVLLLGPAHRVAFQGLAAPSVAAFRTPLGTIPVDVDAIAALSSMPQVAIRDDAHAEEHSLEVQLPFLQRALDDFALIPLVVGSAPPALVSDVISAMTATPGTLVVISSDLSHYLDYESAQRLDEGTVDAILRFDDAAIADAGACGRIPIKGLLGVARSAGLRAELLDRRNSGDTAGSKDRVVGYASLSFYNFAQGKLPDSAGEVLLHVAERALRHGLETGEPLALNPSAYEPALSNQAASFVTVKQGNRLRGCIGSLAAHRPLIVDVAENGFAAGFRDPRFAPLDEADFQQLTSIEVSVLSEPTPLKAPTEDALLASLRPGVDGLILRDDKLRATFLPQVWQQLPDRRTFFQHLLRKAGLPPDHWSAQLQFWTYQTQSFGRHITT